MQRMSFWSFAAIVILIVSSFATPSQAQQRLHGAIAFSPSRGFDGFSFNYNSKGAAQTRAMQYCRERARDCKVVANFRRGCAALAVGKRLGYGVASSTNREVAKSSALATCRQFTTGCKVQRAVCSG